MGRIHLETWIKANPEVCFDLSRSVDLHIDSTQQTEEKAIAGKTSGLMGLDDEVTWQARHFGIVWNLHVKITELNKPDHFQDRQVKGIFRKMVHDHYFLPLEDHTLMKDDFYFECPFGILGKMVEPIVKNHLTELLQSRNSYIKTIAEKRAWSEYI